MVIAAMQQRRRRRQRSCSGGTLQKRAQPFVQSKLAELLDFAFVSTDVQCQVLSSPPRRLDVRESPTAGTGFKIAAGQYEPHKIPGYAPSIKTNPQ